jgi:hypothetical protein
MFIHNLLISTCFGHHYAHRQKNQTVFYRICKYANKLWINIRLVASCWSLSSPYVFTCWVLAPTLSNLPYLAFLINRSHCITWLSRYCLCNKYTTLYPLCVWMQSSLTFLWDAIVFITGYTGTFLVHLASDIWRFSCLRQYTTFLLDYSIFEGNLFWH